MFNIQSFIKLPPFHSAGIIFLFFNLLESIIHYGTEIILYKTKWILYDS